MLSLEHLSLRRVEVLHGVRIRATGAGSHTTHEGGGIHLAAWGRHAHVSDELVRHAAGLRAGLARGMGHAGGHGVTWRSARVLLHSARVRRKRRSHSNHLSSCR